MDSIQPDQNILAQMINLGMNKGTATQALQQVNNSSLEEAISAYNMLMKSQLPIL